MKRMLFITPSHQLQSVVQSGLDSLPPLKFLELSALPLPADLPKDVFNRVLVLRLIIQRQHFRLIDALATISYIEENVRDLHVDDAFIFKCEAARVYLNTSKEAEAIRYFLKAQALLPKVNPDLTDYWYITLETFFMALWDDKNRLDACKKVKRYPPKDHPYYISHNPDILKANLAWSLALNGHFERALDIAKQALEVIRIQQKNSGVHFISEVNLLHLRAVAGDLPTPEEFAHLETLLHDVGNMQLLATLYVAKAITALQKEDDDTAHCEFLKAFEYLKYHPDDSRAPLIVYDQALPFYKERGDLETLVIVLEGRMRVIEAVRRRVQSIFYQLMTQATDINTMRADLDASQGELINKLAAVGEKRDDATGQHTHRVSQLCHDLAVELGCSDAKAIAEASRLHDLGKVGLSDQVLLKAGPLTPEERQTMQKHTIIGESMLTGGKADILALASQIARSHHERWDGMGYPDGLSGEAISLPARIVSVADVYDALTSERPYKRAWSAEEALNEIRFQAGKQFDPAVVTALENVLAQLLVFKKEA